MTSPIDMSPVHRTIVCNILRRHLPPGVKVWVFGSRADWTTKNSSDLDLALESKSKIDYKIIKALDNAFEDSDLPYTVDIIDMNTVSDNFKRIIQSQKISLSLAENKSEVSPNWRKMPFSEAVLLNPPTKLKRGDIYEYIDMAALNKESHKVCASVQREFKGSGSKFQQGDTLMARITPCLENGKIARYESQEDKLEAHGSTEFIVIRGRPNVTDNNFVYYLTLWKKIHNYAIGQMTGTSGRQRVPVNSLNHLIIHVPSLPEQRIIAHILGTLDNKIELNRRMNQTLEETSRVLFKSWFVDFDPVRAKIAGSWKQRKSLPGLPARLYDLFPNSIDSVPREIPKGWDIKPLDEIADFRNGLALQNHRPEENESRLPVVKITQLRNGYADGKEWAKESIAPKCIINDGDVIFSWSGSLLVKVWCGGRAALNQHLFKVTSDKYPKWFYLLWLEQHLKKFQNIAAGKTTTMGHIQLHHLSETECVIPSNDLLNAANEIFECILTKQISNNIQSRSLIALRDTLLPKLMSGKLQVPFPTQETRDDRNY